METGDWTGLDIAFHQPCQACRLIYTVLYMYIHRKIGRARERERERERERSQWTDRRVAATGMVIPPNGKSPEGRSRVRLHRLSPCRLANIAFMPVSTGIIVISVEIGGTENGGHENAGPEIVGPHCRA